VTALAPEPAPAWAEVPPGEARDALAAAPAELRAWHALAASGLGVAWRLWRIGPAADPDGWTLAVAAPGARAHRYTWVRHGSDMRLAAWAELEVPGPAP
jgi:hypothetical protein